MSTDQTLPLFLLGTALYPGGSLPLRVFESRYRRMVGECVENGSTFGVCLIAAGREVGIPAVPYLVGTEARITSARHQRNGVIDIVIRGVRRFRVLDHELERGGLLVARVSWLPEPEPRSLPAVFEELVPVLRKLVDRDGGGHVPAPHRYQDADWVGIRLSEWLPLVAEAKQQLLEMDDALERLDYVQRALRELGLLPAT